MADIPALRPAVIRMLADNKTLRATVEAQNEVIDALKAEMESLKAMVEAEYDKGGSTGGVVG